jgi:DNA-binding response OmpR family regulator
MIATSETYLLDFERLTAIINGKPQHLTRVQWQMLFLFMATPEGKVVTRKKMVDLIFEPRSIGIKSRTVDGFIRQIRKLFGDDCLSMIYGFGWRWELPFELSCIPNTVDLREYLDG